MTRFQATAVAFTALAALAACERKPKQEPNTIPPVAQDNTVPGGESTTVVARTGSQSSGTLGSSTVIGAPPKGQPGIGLGH